MVKALKISMNGVISEVVIDLENIDAIKKQLGAIGIRNFVVDWLQEKDINLKIYHRNPVKKNDGNNVKVHKFCKKRVKGDCLVVDLDKDIRPCDIKFYISMAEKPEDYNNGPEGPEVPEESNEDDEGIPELIANQQMKEEAEQTEQTEQTE